MSIMPSNKVKMPIGMQKSYWAPFASEPDGGHPVYAAKRDMGAARKGYLSVVTATAEVPGDDVIQVAFERFVSGQLDAETDCSDLELNASVFGHTFTAGVEKSNSNDEAPNGAYAFIEPILLKDKSTIYRATFLYKVCAMQSSEKTEADTRTPSGFDPKVNAVSYKVMADNTGDWRDRQEFDTLAEAEAWIDGKFGSGSAFAVSLIHSGPGASVPGPGVHYIVSGESFEIDFGSAPAALYDNGVSVKSSMVGNKYTISAVTAAHDIVSIWTA